MRRACCVLSVIVLSSAVAALPSRAEELPVVKTLLTKIDDGDAKSRALHEPGARREWDAHQDDGYALLRSRRIPLLFREPGQPLTIAIDRAAVRQTMLGYGAAMTDSSAWVLMQLKARNPELYRYTMTRLFSPTEGAGFSVLRLPMGSSDYAATKAAYTYCDEPSPDLSKFSIAHDRQYVIPALKEARRFNPRIAIIGSPWSPPAWMKTNNDLLGVTEEQKSKGITCRLKPGMAEVHAEYFLKFIEAYRAEGIDVYGVTPQNEPQFDGARYPCMRMDEQDQIEWARRLGAKLAAKGLKTRLFVHDHNWALHPNDRKVIAGDAKMNPLQSAVKILSDPEAGKYVAGTAWHCYFGGVDDMRRVYHTLHDRFPDKQILCTELSGWGKQRGAWFGDIEWAMAHNWLGGPQNFCEASLQWNLVLDWRFGPSLRADSEATAAAEVNTDNYRQVRFEREFYAMAQLSRAAPPGARCVAAAVRGNAPQLEVIAFVLPDGGKSLVAFNKASQGRPIQVACGDQWFEYSLPARSIATFLW